MVKNMMGFRQEPRRRSLRPPYPRAGYVRGDHVGTPADLAWGRISYGPISARMPATMCRGVGKSGSQFPDE
jgi:hypothetical protein